MPRGAITGLIVTCVAAIPLSPAFAQHCSPDWTAAYSCMQGCGRCPVSNSPGQNSPAQPPPPTQEELSQQRDAKDLDEAAQDDIDKGDDAYKAGDYANAVKYFTHALSYEPDSDVAQENLRLAQLHLNQAAAAAAAAQQLSAMQESAPSADTEVQSNQARTGFDTAGAHGNALTTPSAHEGSGNARDPVVPPGKQSAAIRTMERSRAKDRQKIAILKAELKKLDPSTDSVKISTIKQEVSTAKSDVQYQNFSIDAELQKPPAAPKPVHR
jgi:tetratricopeptide (TPR) repeat protein